MKKLNKTPDSFGNSDVDTDGFEIEYWLFLFNSV